jgi:hypothetical protein
MNVCRSMGLGLMVLAATCFASKVGAQSQLPSVVQLPSIHTFFYSGTVVVPDSGGAYLGGNRRSASGSSRRGLGRAFGSSLGNPQASVTATIIDHNAIDRQLLGATPEQLAKANGGRVVAGKAKTLDPVEEGKALVRFARKQYREGKKTASFDTYRMAIGVLQGRLRELARVEFRRVFGPAADQSLRMASLHR